MTSTLHVLILVCACTFSAASTAESTRIPQANGTSQNSSDMSGGIVMLSDPEGVVWNDYIHDVYVGIRKKFKMAELPDSAKKGQKGTVRIEFQIRRDGQVPEDSLFLIASGNKDMDDVCLDAIKTTAPFQHLPEVFRGSSIKLRVTFYFNVPKNERSLSSILRSGEYELLEFRVGNFDTRKGFFSAVEDVQPWEIGVGRQFVHSG